MTPEAAPPAGRFVCVVGPSGAGKDTLIDLARTALAGDDRYVFVRRLITRPPSPGEDHEPIEDNDFDERERRGGFAISWRAHGLCYGVPLDVIGQVAAGAVVVCNMSRGGIPAARQLFATAVVMVSAPPEIRARRIASRGRESSAEALGRLARQAEPIAASDCDLVIENLGAPEVGAAALTAFLTSLVAPPAEAGAGRRARLG